MHKTGGFFRSIKTTHLFNITKRTFKLIHSKYTPHVFSFFMALLMSGIMSFVISAFNMGLADSIFLIWLKAWLLAFVIAFPTIILVTPLVKKLVFLVINTQ
jgi:hypothetical protein